MVENFCFCYLYRAILNKCTWVIPCQLIQAMSPNVLEFALNKCTEVLTLIPANFFFCQYLTRLHEIMDHTKWHVFVVNAVEQTT